MHPKSMPRHYKKVHFKEMVPSCVCVDEQQGIFFVRKRMSGGILYRSHVKKCVMEIAFILNVKMMLALIT